MKQTTPMSRTEYAAHTGVSIQSISNWISRGKILPASLTEVVDPDGKTRTKIIPHLADKDREANLSKTAKRDHKLGGRPPGKKKSASPAKGKPKKITAKKPTKIKAAADAVQTADDIPEGVDADMSLNEAERMAKIYKAATAQVVYLETRRKLVNREEDRRKIYAVLQQTVTDLSSLSRKSDIVAELAAEDKAVDVEDILKRVIHQMLSDLADVVEVMGEELGL